MSTASTSTFPKLAILGGTQGCADEVATALLELDALEARKSAPWPETTWGSIGAAEDKSTTWALSTKYFDATVSVEVPAKNGVKDHGLLTANCKGAYALVLCVDARSHTKQSMSAYLAGVGAALDACEAAQDADANFLVLAHAGEAGSGLWAAFRYSSGLTSASASEYKSDGKAETAASGAGSAGDGAAGATGGAGASNRWLVLASEDIPEPASALESSESYDDLRSACIDFTMDRGWELIDADCDLAAATRQSREKDGIARLREALQVVMWRGMERKSGGRGGGRMGMGIGGMGLASGGMGGMLGMLGGRATSESDADESGKASLGSTGSPSTAAASASAATASATASETLARGYGEDEAEAAGKRNGSGAGSDSDSKAIEDGAPPAPDASEVAGWELGGEEAYLQALARGDPTVGGDPEGTGEGARAGSGESASGAGQGTTSPAGGAGEEIGMEQMLHMMEQMRAVRQRVLATGERTEADRAQAEKLVMQLAATLGLGGEEEEEEYAGDGDGAGAGKGDAGGAAGSDQGRAGEADGR